MPKMARQTTLKTTTIGGKLNCLAISRTLLLSHWPSLKFNLVLRVHSTTRSPSSTQLMTYAELNKLQLEVSVCKQRDSGCLARVPLPLLKTILLHLDKHIDEGLNMNVMQKGLGVCVAEGSQALDKWVRSGDGRSLFRKVHDAAKVLHYHPDPPDYFLLLHALFATHPQPPSIRTRHSI